MWLSVSAKKIDKKLYYIQHDDLFWSMAEMLWQRIHEIFIFYLFSMMIILEFSKKYIIIVNGSIERHNSGTEIVKSTEHSDNFVNCCTFSGDL